MHLTDEDLRQIWRDIYLDAVKSSNCVTPDIVHAHAREAADIYVDLLLTDMAKAAAALQAHTAPERAAEVAARLPTMIPVRTADDERRDVLSFLQPEIAKQENAAALLPNPLARERCSHRAEIIRTMAAYIERGDHVGAADREAVKP